MAKYTRYSKHDHKLLAMWASDCADHVLPFFERVNPTDYRPREAIAVLRTWIRMGVFNMSTIRGSSLAAHAAAREAEEASAARFAARAAGQAVATVHVPQHAYGSAYYALKAVVAADAAHAESKLAEEMKWIAQHLDETLRQDVLSRIIIEKRSKRFVIEIQKEGI